MTAPFTHGDQVRLIKSDERAIGAGFFPSVGSIGKVTNVSEACGFVLVQFRPGSITVFDPDQLEHS